MWSWSLSDDEGTLGIGFPQQSLEEDGNDVRVEVGSGETADVFSDLGFGPGTAIEAVLTEGIPGVNDGENARKE